MPTLFNIIVINCSVHFEISLYIFEVYRTVMHLLTFGTSQIITIISNNLKLVHMSQLYLKVHPLRKFF